ncbi:MAG: hypothetical protein Q8T11_16285 [Elusimicrobiota bacterium]|nr:hypothetical protein [Elusimicrobiota bacterium]
MAKKKGGATMLADGHFTFLGETRTDSKNRVVLKGEVSKHYMAYVNDAGQILLEPMALIPTRSFKSLSARTRASVLRGLKQAKEGKGRYLGSFAKHANAD